MAVDYSEYSTVESLRERLVRILEDYERMKPAAFDKRADEPFYLHDVQRFVYLTDKFAYDLDSFSEVLQGISVYSLYYHFIESRLETKLQSDDFSSWIKESLALPALARRIRGIDINVHTLEDLRSRILELVHEFAGEAGGRPSTRTGKGGPKRSKEKR